MHSKELDATDPRIRPCGTVVVIVTHGVDSYDVADVTVPYSYLTPQPCPRRSPPTTVHAQETATA